MGADLRARLAALGFDEVRFARLDPPLPAAGLEGWLAGGLHGDMAWMERTAAKRLDPGLVLPGARSAVLLGVNYLPPPDEDGAAPGARWARYARYRDYHDSLLPALRAAGGVLEEVLGLPPDGHRHYVDTGPVLERAWAARAGLGFVGKNAMLISRTHGNWLFLAVILVRADLDPDPPVRLRMPEPAAVGLLCGSCTRCLDACPTAAFPRPGVVDARRCISYLTIENKGAIPRGLRPLVGDRVYGCDACLEACPWNRFAREGRRVLLEAWSLGRGPGLRGILAMDRPAFAAAFRGTAVKRIKWAGLMRNACVAAGNSGDASLVEPLLALAACDSALVRAHAVWAVRRLGAGARLGELRAREDDAAVLAEYSLPV